MVAQTYIPCTNTIYYNLRHYKVAVEPIWFVFRKNSAILFEMMKEKKLKMKNYPFWYRLTNEETVFLATNTFCSNEHEGIRLAKNYYQLCNDQKLYNKILLCLPVYLFLHLQ